MKCLIVRETRGRMRVHLVQKTKEMSFRQADLIEHRLLEIPGVTRVKVFFRSGNVSVNFEGARCREDLIDAFSHFDFEEYEENHLVPVNTGRIINAEYQDKLVYRESRHFNEIFGDNVLQNNTESVDSIIERGREESYEFLTKTAPQYFLYR